MQGANLGATKQSKFFADPELTEISMRLYVPLLENDPCRGRFVFRVESPGLKPNAGVGSVH